MVQWFTLKQPALQGRMRGEGFFLFGILSFQNEKKKAPEPMLCLYDACNEVGIDNEK